MKNKKRMIAILCAVTLFAGSGHTLTLGADVESESTAMVVNELGDGNEIDIPCVQDSGPGIDELTPEYTAALEKLTTIINRYANPEEYLDDPYYKEGLADDPEEAAKYPFLMTEAQHTELKEIAKEITTNCNSVNAKIKAITTYVADHLIYDTANEYNPNKAYTKPYEVYEHGITVCSGYSNLMRTLLVSAGIPCMNLSGSIHEYNAVYNDDEECWYFVDATWADVGTEGEINTKYISKTCNWVKHDVNTVEHLICDGVSYTLETAAYSPLEFCNQSAWSFKVKGRASGTDLAIQDELEEIPVTYISAESFQNDTVLENIILGKNIEEIDADAFHGCKSVKTLDMSAAVSLKEVKAGSFAEMTGLQSVTLPSSLESIGENAFLDCSSCESVNLEDTKVTSIGANAFSGMTSLKKIAFPNTLTEIRFSAFYGDTALTDINFGDAVLTETTARLNPLGYNAFSGCTALKKLDLSGQTNLSEIPSGLCHGDSALAQVEFPASLETIDSGAFYDCAKLVAVDFTGTKLAKLGVNNFKGCSSLVSAKLPDTLTSMDTGAFSGCSSLEEMNLSGIALTKLGEEAFYQCSSLAGTIDLSSSTITEISKKTFQGCSSLQGLIFPQSITAFRESAFRDCSKLEAFDVSELAIAEIGEYAFNNCNSIRTLDYSKSTFTEVANHQYESLSGLETVCFPDTLEKIGVMAFWFCSSLKKLDLSNTRVSGIGSEAFYGNTSLTEIWLPDTMAPVGTGKSVGDEAFEYIGEDEFLDTMVYTSLTEEQLRVGDTDPFAAPWYGRNVYLGTYQYTIRFDGNGAESGTMDDLICMEKSSYKLPDNTYQRQGYTLAGWNTQADGSGMTYEAGSTVRGLADEADTVCVLYAQWIEADSSVELDNHSQTELRGTVEATCTEDGYTGDTYCLICGKKVASGTVIAAKGHETELRGTVEATCTEEGYTGDTYCKVCGQMLERGSATATKSHTWKKTAAQAATCIAKGHSAYYTCSVCKNSYADDAGSRKIKLADTEIPALGHNNRSSMVKATTTRDGYTINTCTRCKKTSNKVTIYRIKSVNLKTTSYTYDGKAKKPAVTVKDSKGTLIAPSSYTVTYKNHKNVGKATVSIVFRGKYAGTISKTFTINPKGTSISKITGKSKAFGLTWKRQSAQITGYEMQYSTSSKFTAKISKTVKIAGTRTTTKNISKLKAKKKYYIRIRTYKTVGGKKYVSAWSKAKSIVTKK